MSRQNDFAEQVANTTLANKLIYLLKEYRYCAITSYDWCDCIDSVYCAILRDLDQQSKDLGIPGIEPESGDYHDLAKKI